VPPKAEYGRRYIIEILIFFTKGWLCFEAGELR